MSGKMTAPKINARIFEETLDSLLSPDAFDFNPFPDILPGDDAGDAAPATDFAVASAPRPRRAITIDADASIRSRAPPRAKGRAPAAKRPRSSANQAETQKRYRERKKMKMDELEKTIEALRAEVQDLRARRKDSINAASGSAPRAPRDGPAPRAESIVGAGENSRGGSDDTDAAPGPPAAPASPTSAAEDLDSLGDRFGGDMAAEALRGAHGGDEFQDSIWSLALEVGDAMRRGSAEDSAGGAARGRRRFTSYADVELWFGNAERVYDLAVEKIRGLLLVGASDADVRAAIDDVVLIVNDARCSRPELATVTTQQSCVQMMMEHFEGGADLLKVCKTSSAWMVKSIVDATRMEGDWGEIVAKIKENVSPKEVDEIVRWGDEYYQELSAKVLRKRLDVVRRFAAHVESGSVAEKTYYNAPIDALRRREGEMAEVYDSLLGSVQDEMEMHLRGVRDLFARLSPRAAATLVVSSHPTAIDPFLLAKALRVDARAEKLPTNEESTGKEDAPRTRSQSPESAKDGGDASSEDNKGSRDGGRRGGRFPVIGSVGSF